MRKKPRARLTAPKTAVKFALDLDSLCMDCNPHLMSHFFFSTERYGQYERTAVIQKEPQEQAEHCVLCGRRTEYSTQKPIDQRYGYIEGAGQLCRDCYSKLYLKGRASYG